MNHLKSFVDVLLWKQGLPSVETANRKYYIKEQEMMHGKRHKHRFNIFSASIMLFFKCIK